MIHRTLGAQAKLWRGIEAATTDRLSSKGREALWSRLREDEDARAQYDRTFDVLRALEGEDVLDAELSVVEDWLFDDLEAQAASQTRPAWWRLPWLGIAAAMASALVLAVGPLRPQPDDDGFGARGAIDDRGLAIEALCPSWSGLQGATTGLVPAAEHGCALADTLSFAYRLDPRSPLTMGTLTLFGLDAQGDPLYYTPTPIDADAPSIDVGSWRPLSMVVELPVNHEPGAVVLYGLISERAPSIEEIDALAKALGESSPVRIGDPPWHRRLLGRDALERLCPTPNACESAELPFEIHEDPR